MSKLINVIVEGEQKQIRVPDDYKPEDLPDIIDAQKAAVSTPVKPPTYGQQAEQAARGYHKRDVARFENIGAPTQTGEWLGYEPGTANEIIAGVPERVVRTLGAIGGTAADVLTTGTGTLLQGAGKVLQYPNKLLGGIPGKALSIPLSAIGKVVAPIAEAYQGYKERQTPGGQANLATIGDLAGTTGLLLAPGGLQVAGKGMGTVGKEIAKGAVERPLNISQNIAAARASIPLTRGQAASLAGGTKPSGFWGNVEAWTRSMPGAAGEYAKMNRKQATSAVESLKKVFGDRLEAIDENYAKKIIDNVDKNYQKSKDIFSGAYADAIKNGKISYIQGDKVADEALKVINNMPETAYLPEAMKNKVGKFLADIKDVKNKTISGEAGGSNYEAYRNLQSSIIAEKAAAGEKIWQAGAGANAKQGRDYATVLNVITKKMKDNEYAHLRMIGGNDLVDNLKIVDKLYGEEAGQLQAVKKIFGLGREAGEKGFVEENTALTNILNPKNTERLKVAVQYLDDEGKENLGKALMSKLIKSSTKSTVTEGERSINTIMVDSFRRNFMNNRENFKKILGEDKVRQFDDLLTGMEKARLKSVNIADEWNPSGTGFKNALMALIGVSAGAGTGMGYHSKNPIIGYLTGLSALAAATGAGKVIGKIATKAPLQMPRGTTIGSRLGEIGQQARTATGRAIETVGRGIEKTGDVLTFKALGKFQPPTNVYRENMIPFRKKVKTTIADIEEKKLAAGE